MIFNNIGAINFYNFDAIIQDQETAKYWAYFEGYKFCEVYPYYCSDFKKQDLIDYGYAKCTAIDLPQHCPLSFIVTEENCDNLTPLFSR